MRITTSSGGRGKSKGGGFLSAVIFIVFGFVISYFTQDMIAEAKESENWPSVQGQVVKSEVTSYISTDSDGNQTMYSAVIQTRYEVEGKQFTTSSVNLSGSSSTSVRSMVQNKADQYPVGRNVSVYYDPIHPDNAVLEPGLPILYRILSIVPYVLYAAAGLMIIRSILKLAGIVTTLGFLAAKREKKKPAAVSGSEKTQFPAGTPGMRSGETSVPAGRPDPEQSSTDDSDDGFSI